MYGDKSLHSRGAMYVKRNIETPSCKHCCNGKTVSITYCRFLALGIHHAKRMRLIVLSSVAYLALQHMYTRLECVP
jgi:hypothetical protein